jgi:hypothetical protein
MKMSEEVNFWGFVYHATAKGRPAIFWIDQIGSRASVAITGRQGGAIGSSVLSSADVELAGSCVEQRGRTGRERLVSAFARAAAR